MKLNGSNTLQGLYNYNTAPEGVIYTKGDLVLYDSVLYTCLGETSSIPNVNEEEWEYYINSLGPVTDGTALDDISNSNRLVTANSVREYLQKAFPGSNSNGSLKVKSDGSLDDVVINSKFQLDNFFLAGLKNSDPTSIPFTPSFDKVYVLTTLGNFSGSNFENQTLYHQEIMEISSSGKTTFWYRTGASLEMSPWKTLDVEKNISEYKNYLDALIEKAAYEKSIYENFMDDISTGEYKFWKSIPSSKVNTIGSTIIFTDDATPFQTEYKKDKHYRVYLVTTESSSSYRYHIDITPDDHTFLEVGEELLFKDISGLTLERVQTSRTELNIPVGTQIVGLYQSEIFSI
jgi:hypothetical protein